MNEVSNALKIGNIMIHHREMDKTDQWKFVPDGKMEIPLLLETLNFRNGIFLCNHL